MGMKSVIMRGGNGKPVSLPTKLADGLVKMRKASFPEEKLKPKTESKKKEQPKAKTPTYQTRALQAEKPSEPSTLGHRLSFKTKTSEQPKTSSSKSDSPEDE